MNKLWLFRELRRHRKLSEKRMVDLEKNKVAKWIMNFVVGMVVVYMLMFSIILALGANETRTMSALEFICGGIPIIVLIDFFIRFSAQQTPSQIIKPYVLLPIPKYTCIEFFLTGQMLNWSNLIWFILLVPFCLMSVLFSYGFWAFFGLLLFFWLLELCISQAYLIVRTLINDTLLWWLLPVGVILLGMTPGINTDKLSKLFTSPLKVFDFDDVFGFYAHVGEGIERGFLWPYLMVAGLLVMLFLINRHIQYTHVMRELSRTEKVTLVKNPSEMKFLSRFGELGLFLGLEIRTILRNKNPRKSFIMGTVIIIVFSIVIIFTDTYDSPYMGNFWCIYNYAIFGAMTLVKVMANEGNYIDGLMVRKESILQILKAKYWFNCIVLLLPFLLMMPTVISGKWSFLMVLSYGVFTAGFQFFLLFQLAVTNKTSQPLNTKFISKNGMENSKWQLIIQMFCMFVPVVVVSLLQAAFGSTVAYSIMLVVGMAFIATHKIWLRNVYNRFMTRRYQNLEGFRASR